MKRISYMLTKIERFLRPFSLFLIGGFIVGIVIDLLNFQENSDIRLFLLLAFGILISRLLRLKSEATFKLALGFLALLFILFIIDRSSLLVERIAVWLYMLLLIGIIQQFVELRKA